MRSYKSKDQDEWEELVGLHYYPHRNEWSIIPGFIHRDGKYL
jgi:hypothetical protein